MTRDVIALGAAPGHNPAMLESIAPQFHPIGSVRLAVRTVGRGPALIFVHGWPFHGLSWRKLVPLLAERYTCIVPDLPGAGLTQWSDATSFAMPDHARLLRALADALGLSAYALVAHDTGATIARLLAADDPRVRALVMANTEIPGHRPPWIPLYRHASRLPLAASVFRLLLRSEAFRRSSLGYGGCFHDSTRLDGEFFDLYVRPQLEDPRRLDGQLRFLWGVDFGLVDALADVHRRIAAPVLMAWGADDRTFPLADARRMPAQFPRCTLEPIANAAFLVHEERPEAFARVSLPFLAAALPA
jgi:haloalkane dehalogenase